MVVLPPHRRGRIFALEGASGVGKTTAARAVTRIIGARWIPEAYARLSPAPSLDFRDRDELLALELRLLGEEVRRYREALRTAAAGETVILDTGTLGPLTYAWGLRAATGPEWDVVAALRTRAVQELRRGRLGLPEFSLYLDAPPTAPTRRALGSPETHPPRLLERHRRVGVPERRLWLYRFPRILPGRFGWIDATAGPEPLATAVASRLRSRSGLGPVSPSGTERLLAELGTAFPPRRR